MTKLSTVESLLFMDKVTFTLNIPSSMKPLLLKKINNKKLYDNYKRKVYRGSIGRYNNNYQFTIYKNITIEVSLYPINTNQNFIRVEYNPNKLGKIGRKALRVFLIKLLGVSLTKQIYFQANLTRIDLTLDNYQMENDLYIYRPGSKYSTLYRHNGKDISSQVIGSDSSDIRTTLYDKDTQQKKRKKGTHTSYQRLEIRFRLRNCTMATVKESLLDEFGKIRFYRSSFLDDQRLDSDFITTTKESGITLAMSQLNDLTRRRYRRYLENHRVYPINEDDLNFDLAHFKAFTSLVHQDFIDKQRIERDKSLLRSVVVISDAA